MRTKKCIFCDADGDKVQYSREHVIPDSIGGSLVIRDCVCKPCNDVLGSEVDPQIWSEPDTVNACTYLNIPCSHNNIIKNHYTVKGFLGRNEVPVRPKVTAEGVKWECPPHKRDDGVMVYPANAFRDNLRQNLQKKEGYSKENADKLFQSLETAGEGEVIHYSSQKQTFVKRSQSLTTHITPKQKPCVDRLIAKIAYEFLFVVAGESFLAAKSLSEPLRNLSRYGQPQEGINVVRVKSDKSNYEPFHAITFYPIEASVMLYVTIFGHILYALTAGCCDAIPFLDPLRQLEGCSHMVGLDYEQKVLENSRGIRAILEDNKFVPIWESSADKT